jgi:hypothetical protein
MPPLVAMTLRVPWVHFQEVTMVPQRRFRAPVAQRLSLVAAGLLLVALAAPAAAQTDGTDRIARAIEGVSASLARIAAALEQDARAAGGERELRRVEVAVAALNLRLRRLERLDAELRAFDQEEDEIRSATSRLEDQLARLEDVSADERASAEAKRERAELENQITWLGDRGAAIARRRVDAQNELSREESRLASLESILAEWIESQTAPRSRE